MKRLMIRTLALLGTAMLGWAAWQKHRDVSNPWPPKGWDPSAPPEDEEPAASVDEEGTDADPPSPAEDPTPEPPQAPPASEAPEPPAHAHEDTPPETEDDGPSPALDPDLTAEPAATAPAHEDPVLALANGATEAELQAIGVTPSAVRTLLGGRPFADREALAGTRGIGPKTLAALDRGADR